MSLNYFSQWYYNAYIQGLTCSIPETWTPESVEIIQSVTTRTSNSLSGHTKNLLKREELRTMFPTMRNTLISVIWKAQLQMRGGKRDCYIHLLHYVPEGHNDQALAKTKAGELHSCFAWVARAKRQGAGVANGCLAFSVIVPSIARNFSSKSTACTV